MENTRNYVSFSWHNQSIDGKLVNSVRVRVFNSVDVVTSNGNYKLAATDGNTIQKSRHSYLRYTSDYSYAILSTGIRERCSISEKPYFYLYIKVYVMDNFDVLMLKDKDLLEKSFVLEALSGLNTENNLSSKSVSALLLIPLKKAGFIGCLEKEISRRGDDFETVYNHLLKLAQEGSIDEADELMTSYNITCIYQAVFWKELYRLTKETK